MKKEEKNIEEETTKALSKTNVSCSAYWKKIDSLYVPATALMIGKIEVARFFYDGVTRGDLKYKCTSKMPTIKSYLGNYKTEDECRSVCLKVAKLFFEQLQHCN